MLNSFMSLDIGTVPISFLHLVFVPKWLKKKNKQLQVILLVFSIV